MSAGTFTNGTSNGVPQPATEAQAERELTASPIALGYRPSPVGQAFWYQDGSQIPYYRMAYDIPGMLVHPHVLIAYNWYKAGIANAEFQIKASSPDVERFAQAELNTFWERSLGQAQLVYDYGWLGAEASYHEVKGLLRYHSMHSFHPTDVWALTRKHKFVGVSVQNVEGETGVGLGSPRGGLRLWGAGRWPAKGLWFVHNREYDRFYGRSQLYGAWRPWRRLAGRDAAEEVTDMAVYRFGVAGPTMWYPPTLFQKNGGQIDYDAAREKSREFTESAKAGASVSFPNVRDKDGNKQWELEWPDHTIEVHGLMEYMDALRKEIACGIGVPPELLEASETGSGYSGRMIPMIGYYASQVQNARNFVHGFLWQVLLPLIRWNYGRNASCEVNVKLKLPTELTGQPAQGAGQPGAGGPPGQPGAAPPGGGPSGAGAAPPEPPAPAALPSAPAAPAALPSAPAAPPSPPSGGAPGVIPFRGPHGGKWLRNLKMGKLRHATMGTELATEDEEEIEYELAATSDLCDRIDRAAADADPNPTEAQRASGNYRKGHITIQGLPITIEVARGGTRSGVSASGKPWSVTMRHHYGYIKGTESDADCDHADVFIGPDPESELVFIVNQNKPDGTFDEHKCMVGFHNEADARQGYLDCYAPRWKGLGSIVPLTMADFKDWLEDVPGKALEMGTNDDYELATRSSDWVNGGVNPRTGKAYSPRRWTNGVTVRYQDHAPGSKLEARQKTAAERRAAVPAKPVKPTVDAVHAEIGAIDRAAITPDVVKGLAEKLTGMTVKDLHALKAKLGITGSGAKGELAKKLAERALGAAKGRKLAAKAGGVTGGEAKGEESVVSEPRFTSKLPSHLSRIDDHGLTAAPLGKKGKAAVETASRQLRSVLQPEIAQLLSRIEFAGVSVKPGGKVDPEAGGIFLPGGDKGDTGWVGLLEAGLGADQGQSSYVDDSAEGVVRHEIGHAIEHLLPYGTAAELRQVLLVDNPAWFPSFYGEENNREKFAEFFSLVTKPGFKIKSLPESVRPAAAMLVKTVAKPGENIPNGNPTPEKQPEKALPSPAPHTKPAAHHVLSAVDAHAGPHNLAPMAKIRKHLAEQGITDRAAQDKAINDARRAGHVTASTIEGRHGVTQEERDNALRENGQMLGMLSRRKS